jgi:integrase
MAKKSRRAGSIIERPPGSGRWRVTLYVGEVEDKDGRTKRRYLSRTVKGTKRDAELVLAELLKAREMGDTTVDAKTRLSDFAATWLDTLTTNATVRPRTAADYRSILNRYVLPTLGRYRIGRLQPTHLRRLYGELRERGLAARTVRQAHEVVRNLLNAAVRDGIIARNPATLAANVLPKEERREPTTIERDKLVAFLDAAETAAEGPLWTVLLLTGLRPSEALALRWSDIDLEGRRLRVQRVLVERAGVAHAFAPPKSQTSRRTVPLAARVVAALRAQRKAQATARLFAGEKWKDQGLVFTNTTGGPLRQSNLRPKFVKLLDAAGLPRIRPYDLRHSCATLLLEDGEDIAVVSAMLGHSSLALTAKHYAHVTERRKRDAVGRWDRLAGGA